MIDRLTVKSESVKIGGHECSYSLRELCVFDSDGNVTDELSCEDICTNSCDNCVIQNAFDRLAEYENIGLSPKEIMNLLESEKNNIKLDGKVADTVSSDAEKEYTDLELEKLWEAFGDVPMNPETEVMADDFLHFPKGTHREDIWKWFDQKHSKGVHFLLYGDGKK